MTEIQQAMIKSADAMRNAFYDIGRKKLCHYTSPSGLLGIFSEQKPSLYFSQYDSLNDTKERKDIFDSLKKYCNEQLKKKRMSKELYDDILSIPQSDLFGITRKTNEELLLDDGEIIKEITSFANEECYTYICSFSKNNDSLPMWRMYSKADHYEGFCVEFSETAFAKKIYNSEGFSLELVKVIYDENKKMELIESVLSPIMRLYDSATEKDKESLLSVIKMMIKTFQFVFKNESFSYEEETRAILHIPKSEKSFEGKISERRYRQSNGLIVPYVVFYVSKGSVYNITIAPTIKEEIAINNLKDYLCSKGLNHVRIIPSNIPIRNI